MTKNKRLLWQVPFLVLLIIGTIVIIHGQKNAPYRKCQGTIFGTTYHITYQHTEDLKRQLVEKMNEVDRALSMFNEKSVLSAINQGATIVPQTTEGDMFAEVCRLAMKVSEDTEGAFDITVAPLVNAWGFGFKNGEMPTKQQVDSLRQLVGYQKVSCQTKNGKTTIRKHDSRMMLDCSAIAKGYGVDMVARELEKNGVSNYMVEIGGEIATKGISEKRLPWKIGVTKPTDNALQEGGELQTVLNITDKCMATSGNYRNFYYKGGKRYAHTIDPKTGYPVQHNILSATVLADQCAKADAYATAFMVMGLEKAQKVLERNPDLMGYFIYDNNGKNEVWQTEGMKN
jgi:thiamine biosynthesis lipoprotein